jgi:hypothetical protein
MITAGEPLETRLFMAILSGRIAGSRADENLHFQ